MCVDNDDNELEAESIASEQDEDEDDESSGDEVFASGKGGRKSPAKQTDGSDKPSPAKSTSKGDKNKGKAETKKVKGGTDGKNGRPKTIVGCGGYEMVPRLQ